jgi:hypothetical protein
VFFSKATALLLLLSWQPLIQLAWPLQQAIVMKTIDMEEDGNSENNYAYVTDEEMFLNVGRVAGVGLFFLLTYLVSSVGALRFAPMIVTLLQLGVWIFISSLSRNHYEN